MTAATQPRILITTELAVRIGALAAHYLNHSCEIAYDARRAEQLWQVTFEGWDEDGAPEHHRYVINDETGEATADTSPAGLGPAARTTTPPWRIAAVEHDADLEPAPAPPAPQYQDGDFA